MTHGHDEDEEEDVHNNEQFLFIDRILKNIKLKPHKSKISRHSVKFLFLNFQVNFKIFSNFFIQILNDHFIKIHLILKLFLFFSLKLSSGKLAELLAKIFQP